MTHSAVMQATGSFIPVYSAVRDTCTHVPKHMFLFITAMPVRVYQKEDVFRTSTTTDMKFVSSSGKKIEILLSA